VLWLHSCLTAALDGGERSTPLPGGVTAVQRNLVPSEEGAGRGPEPFWIVLEDKKNLSPTVMKICMYIGLRKMQLSVAARP
jgi:hypothetical protein